MHSIGIYLGGPYVRSGSSAVSVVVLFQVTPIKEVEIETIGVLAAQ